MNLGSRQPGSGQDTGGLRPAAVAGMFYAGGERNSPTPSIARSRPRRVLAASHTARAPRGAGAAPKALIVPHAGYVYSGAVAAAPTRGSPRARPSGASCCSAPATACRCAASPCPAARPSRHRSATCPSTGRPWPRSPLPQVVREHAAHALRALARGAAAVPAGACSATSAGAARRRRRHCARSGRGHRAPVGRARDADRRELRPVALPPLRRSAGDDRATVRRSCAATASTTSRPAARRLSTA